MITITKTKDIQIIKGVIEDLWDEATGDNIQMQFDEIPWEETYDFNEDTFYLIWDVETLAGMIGFNKFDGDKWELHMNMYKEYRGEYATTASIGARARFKLEHPEATLVALVPEYFRNILKFSVKNGFVIKGHVAGREFIKDGVTYQTLYLEEK